MNRVCILILNRVVIIFIDDILVYSKIREQHEEHLRDLLGMLRKYMLYANLSKCEFCLWEVKFLGHIVNQNEILVDLAKIEAFM